MSKRYKAVSRRILAERDSILRLLMHYGIYDQRYNEVLDLGYDDRDDSIVIRIRPLEEFAAGEPVKFELVPGMSTDSEIESRWHTIYSAWQRGELNELKFNPFSLNCETLVFYVLTGKEHTPSGEEAEDLFFEIVVKSLKKLANSLKSWSSDLGDKYLES